jgi:phage tail sheath protein FI
VSEEENKVSSAVNKVRQQGYNSSYAACYYPWVQVKAPITGLPTWAPPSVVALGAMSYGQATQAVWFAPAGFTRGGLSEGRGGLPVVNVSQRLSSKERDSLYENNINPIAQFPAEGIVIFGQKTLQATPSALDRINVRRLMIYIKKRISRIASTLLFEPNVSATWARFTSQVAPFLDSIKTGFGLEDFKVVLDSSTTTADLIDRNTMYAKIYVKPTKAVEFIAIDFIVTNQGASFDD